VTVEVRDEEGRTGRSTVTPADPRGHLARIHGEDCAAAAVAAGGAITVAEPLDLVATTDGQVGVLEIRFDPRPGGPEVTITEVSRTVLTTPRDLPGSAPATEGGWLPVDLGTRGARTATLAFVPARCDRHAVADDKRGTVFAVRTIVDGAPQEVVYVAASDAVRGEVFRFIAQTCGWQAAIAPVAAAGAAARRAAQAQVERAQPRASPQSR